MVFGYIGAIDGGADYSGYGDLYGDRDALCDSCACIVACGNVGCRFTKYLDYSTFI